LAWEWVNATSSSNGSLFALPSDLETTASVAQVTYRAIANQWTVWVFIALTGFLLIWCNCLLLWVLAQSTAAPNSSAFAEVDINSKSTYSSIDQQSIRDEENRFGTVATDFSSMLRGAGLGNAESKAIIQSLKDKILRVAGMDGPGEQKILVLVTGTGTGEDLRNMEGLETLKRGMTYL
jgi:hypothetical protein